MVKFSCWLVSGNSLRGMTEAGSFILYCFNFNLSLEGFVNKSDWFYTVFSCEISLIVVIFLFTFFSYEIWLFVGGYLSYTDVKRDFPARVHPEFTNFSQLNDGWTFIAFQTFPRNLVLVFFSNPWNKSFLFLHWIFTW
jgi:hypothetical protein